MYQSLKIIIVRLFVVNKHVMMEHALQVDGVTCIQIHPMFLYESVWTFCLLLVLLACLGVFRKDGGGRKPAGKRPEGMVFWLYLGGYALGRVWMEGLRTDQLLWPGTRLAVSQLLAALLLVISAGRLIYRACTLRSK